MITDIRIASPEWSHFEEKHPKRPSLEWFVFVINELCPRSLIWSSVYRGKSMLYVAAQKHGYSKSEIEEFLGGGDFSKASEKVVGNYADIHAEEHCFAILIDGCDGEKKTQVPTLI